MPVSLIRSGIIVCVLVGGLTVPAAAQSTDPHHPTTLGLGVNKPNISNDVSGHYYTFLAGPGHVDVELAFQQMGLFGRPMPQHVNFDFWSEEGAHLSHIELLSEDGLMRRHTDADLPKQQRINLAVTTQWGAIKVGGYYEVELKGAVEQAPPVGAAVKPEVSEPLTRP